MDDTFSPELVSNRPLVTVTQPTAMQSSSVTTEQTETLMRLLEEQDSARSAQADKARLQAEKRKQALVSAGQLLLFPEAA